MRIFRGLGLSMIAAGMLVTYANAQVPVQEDQERAFNSMMAPANLALGALPGAQLAEKISAVELILEGTQEEGAGTASFGWKYGSNQFRAKFSSPITKSSKETIPFDLVDGLPSGATFEFTAANLMWSQASDQDLEDLKQLCMVELKRPSCDIGDLPDSARAEARRLLKFDDIPKYIGVSTVIAQRDFDFVDATLKKQPTESNRNISGTVRVGAFSETFGFGFVSWSYQQQYIPGNAPQQICVPIDGTLGLSCDELVIGAPKKKIASIIGLELRHFFSPSLAITPSIKWDLKADITSVSLPVYFFKSKDGGLAGGIRSSWRSDQDSIALVVFVGTSLTLTP